MRGFEQASLRRPRLEYRSPAMLWGLPVVHAAFGGRDEHGRYRPAVARGVFAFGDVAVGLVAVGGVAVGLLGFGGVALGLVALGGLAFGLVALAGVAVGLTAVGAVAIGLKAIGAIAVGLKAVGPVTASALLPRGPARARRVPPPATSGAPKSPDVAIPDS